MAIVAAFAYDAFPNDVTLPQWACIAFAMLCCAVIGWPLSRYLSRYLVAWEARDTGARVTNTERF
jgi:hypothetical protein